MAKRFWICLVAGMFAPLMATPCLAQVAAPFALEVPLFPGFDNFGNQFQTIQIYGEGANAAPAFGIYDTGASVVTLSIYDRASFVDQGFAIPIVPGGTASATAVGGSGTLTGDVSQPGLITALPYSAFSFETGVINMTGAVSVPGVQMFVGTELGSPVLPTITGTPIHTPSGVPGSINEFGIAAKIQMQGGVIDLGAMFAGLLPELNGITLTIPEIGFVSPGSTLAPTVDTYTAVNIPVKLYGEDTSSNPGLAPTVGFNPVVESTAVMHNSASIGNKTFLFDTGAQLSIISTEMALGLGLDLNNPEDEVEVQGASGTVAIPGFTVDKLQLPRTDGGTIDFLNVPVYVLDIGEGLDGILGMNLFNGADGLLYDPTLPQPIVSATFLTNRLIEVEEEGQDEFDSFAVALNSLTEELRDVYAELGIPFDEDEVNELMSVFSLGLSTSKYGAQGNPIFIGFNPVPEPTSALLASIALAGLVGIRRRIKRCSKLQVA
jgi:hypothetical protein